LVLLLSLQCFASLLSPQLVTSAAFTSSSTSTSSHSTRRNGIYNRYNNRHGRIMPPRREESVLTIIYSSSGGGDDDELLEENSILDRFVSPKIDDAGLPIADSLLSQIVAPTMQITYLSIVHAPIPSWLYSTTSASNGMLFASSSSAGSGSLIVPTLIHGAGLTLCWVLGCLASKNYESDAFNISGGRGYTTVIKRLVQSGSFAVGLLILSTQFDLLLEYGRYVQPGESDEIDLRLLNAIVEVANDIVFEAGVLSLWRIYRASLTGSADGRPPNYKP